jgi:hypothetical protein
VSDPDHDDVRRCELVPELTELIEQSGQRQVVLGQVGDLDRPAGRVLN